MSQPMESMDISQASGATVTPPQLQVEAAFIQNSAEMTLSEEELNRIQNGSGNGGTFGEYLGPPSPTHSQDSCHMDDAISVGEIDVRVKPALQRNPSQLNSNMPIYKMDSHPRGMALIVEVEKFDNDVQDPRVGSHIDVVNLKRLFKGLHFGVRVHQNLTRAELNQKLTDFADDPEQVHADMMILVVLSHGKDGHIYTSDGLKYETENIYRKFNNQNCPNLKGKPKFFIVQACRGEDTDKGHYSSSSNPPSPSVFRDSGPSAARKRRVTSTERDTVPFSMPALSEIDKARPTWEDMIIAYSTIPGFASIRDHDRGTWFVQSVVEVFMNHAHDRELIDLLRMTSERLSRFTNDQGEKQTCNIEMRHFYRRLYFNPTPMKKNGRKGAQLMRSKSTPPSSPRRHSHEDE